MWRTGLPAGQSVLAEDQRPSRSSLRRPENVGMNENENEWRVPTLKKSPPKSGHTARPDGLWPTFSAAFCVKSAKVRQSPSMSVKVRQPRRSSKVSDLTAYPRKSKWAMSRRFLHTLHAASNGTEPTATAAPKRFANTSIEGIQDG